MIIIDKIEWREVDSDKEEIIFNKPEDPVAGRYMPDGNSFHIPSIEFQIEFVKGIRLNYKEIISGEEILFSESIGIPKHVEKVLGWGYESFENLKKELEGSRNLLKESFNSTNELQKELNNLEKKSGWLDNLCCALFVTTLLGLFVI